MKIVHILPSWEIGGAETLVLHLSAEMLRRGHEVSVIAWRDKGTLEPEFRAHGVTTLSLGVGGRFGLKQVQRCFGAVRDGRFDVVHAHLFPVNYWVSVFPRSIGRRIYTEHSITNRRRRIRWVRPIERVVYSRFDVVVGVSEEVRESLRAWLPSRAVACVPNGIPIGEMSKQYQERGGHGPGRVLFVGRLTYAKGVDVLLRAVAIERALGRVFMLDIVGDGEERQSLEGMARSLGVSEQVSFHGYRRDLARFYEGRPVVVLPSRWEGLPMTLLEAMGAGCPVIATRVGGVPEALDGKSGDVGLLVEPEAAEALGSAIRRVMADPIFARDLGERARFRVAERYSIERTADRYLSMYSGEEGCLRTDS